MAIQLLRRLFTIDEYQRMARAGILGESDRVELIEGEIVEMAPIGSRHAAVVARLTALFGAVGQQAIVWVQNPVSLGEYSQPQPDIALLRHRSDFYADAHPGPQNVLLLVEVADTSLEYDRQVKLPLYARAGIAEVWLVDLERQQVEVHRSPSDHGYQDSLTVGMNQSIAPSAFPDLELVVKDILGDSL